jgi:N-acetyl-gamma-glutamyl-phosphate reductase
MQERGSTVLSAAVVGAAGYTGIELVRLLVGHPGFDVTMVTSTADAGRAVDDLYPALAGCGLTFTEPDAAAIADAADVVFLAVPHTAAMPLVPGLLDSGCRVIDLSADFRLKDAAVFEAWYGEAHTAPELLGQAVYGLPELNRADLHDARLVACPGCYPTAAALAVAPALTSGLARSDRVIVDAKSGVSGAGRTPTPSTHYCSADESVTAYKVAAHRHTPEIAQTLSGQAGRAISVTFTPHLVPMSRGLLATAYVEVAPGTDGAAAHAAYADRFAGEPFITVHPQGRMPSTAEVRGSNRVHIGVEVDTASSTLVVTCAIDNLVKGSGGQAVQCANIALRLHETDGLTWPVPVV